jgi:hypothetical protein
MLMPRFIKQFIPTVFFGFFLLFSAQAQQLSNKATVSVITCGPGSEMYSAFGHSAFRVSDPIIGLDKIYNYGTFDFNAPNFYLNFAKGNLIYQLSTTRFAYFLQVYDYENRWVTAQELNLDQQQVQAVFNYLENNALPKNRSYRYDFFFENCATKIEDVIVEVLQDSVTFTNNHINTSKTYRNLIADYTATNFKWGKFGIDLALGSVIDVPAPKDDYKFLPDYILEAFAHATIIKNGKPQPLVKQQKNILKNQNYSPSVIVTPFWLLFVLSTFLLYITYKNIKNNKRSKWVDFFVFFITGTIGLVVLLLWFATAHTATYKNLNFLWAFAPNFIMAFYMLQSKIARFAVYYLAGLLLLLVIMTVVWILKIQVFNIALIPLLLFLAVRYVYLIKYFKKTV